MQKIGFCDQYGLTHAVISGNKTMTRRIERELERTVADYEKDYEESFDIISQTWDLVTSSLSVSTPHGIIKLKTRYKLDEVVAIAQSYRSIHNKMMNGNYADSKYDAFRRAMVIDTKGWSNKMFVRSALMPLHILITGVRIERLKHITSEDCLKEGIYKYTDSNVRISYYINGISEWFLSPRDAFATLINSPGVGRKGLWESNPFSVVYDFTLVD